MRNFSNTHLAVDEEGAYSRRFFKTKRIGLGTGEKDTLYMQMEAVRTAYEFTLAIDYEVGGEKFTQTVDRAGQPFRVAPIPCAEMESVQTVPQPDREALAAVTYEQAATYEWDLQTSDFRLRAFDSAEVCDFW